MTLPGFESKNDSPWLLGVRKTLLGFESKNDSPWFRK